MTASAPAPSPDRPAVGLRRLSRPEGAILGLLATAAAILRIAYQSGRAFVGDEAGTLLVISEMGYGEILTTFRDPWLSMNLYLAMEKWLSGGPGGEEWALVAPGLIAGVALVPLTAALALRFTGPAPALLAAALVAANPFLVFYSVQIRSYILLVAFSIAALVAFVDWTRDERAGDAWRCAAFGTLAVLMHVNGLYFGLFLGALLAVWLFAEGRPDLGRGRRALGIVGPVAAGALVAAAAYAPVLEQMLAFRGKWSDVPPSSLSYLPAVFSRYFGEGWWGLPSLAAFGVGLWVANERNRPLSWLALGFVVPVAALSWIGFVHFPWVHARYLVTSIPIIAVFMAVGLAASTGRAGRGWTLAGLAVLLGSWAPELASMFEDKRALPWRSVGAYLEHRTRPGDIFLTTDVGQLYPNVTLAPLMTDRGRSFKPVRAFLSGVRRTSGRLVVVNPHHTIDSETDQTTFGEIQILFYGDGSREEAARQLLGDLRRSVEGFVAPELTGHYRLIGDLLDELEPESPLRSLYMSAFYQCLMRTERQRHTPVSSLPEEMDEPASP